MSAHKRTGSLKVGDVVDLLATSGSTNTASEAQQASYVDVDPSTSDGAAAPSVPPRRQSLRRTALDRGPPSTSTSDATTADVSHDVHQMGYSDNAMAMGATGDGEEQAITPTPSADYDMGCETPLVLGQPMDWLQQLETALRQGKIEFEEGTNSPVSTSFAPSNPFSQISTSSAKVTPPVGNVSMAGQPHASPSVAAQPMSSPMRRKQTLRRQLSTLVQRLSTATDDPTPVVSPQDELPVRPTAFGPQRIRDLPHRNAITALFVFPDSQEITLRVTACQTVAEVKKAVWESALTTIFATADWSQYDWWHGSVPRDEAANRLLMLKTNGHFLVRESASRESSLALSCYFSGDVRHLRIHYRQQRYSVGNADEVFSSLADLITHYSQFSLPLFGSATPAARAVLLTIPCKRTTTLPSNQPKRPLFRDARGESSIQLAPLARRLGGVDGHEAIWLASGAGDGFVHEIHHENLSVLHVPPFKYSFLKPAAELLVLHVVWKVQNDTSHQNLLEAALGRVPDWGDEENAIASKSLTDHCLAIKAGRDPAAYAISPSLISFPASNDLQRSDLRIVLQYGWDGSSSNLKIVHVKATALPLAIKEQALGSKELDLERYGWQESGREPGHYLLKVPGRFEYIEGPFALLNFKWIRQAVLRGDILQLQLLPRDDLIDQKWHPDEFGRSSSSMLSPSFEDEFSPGSPLGLPDLSGLNPSRSTLPSSTPPHHQISVAGRHHENVPVFSVWDVPFAFRVRLAGVDDLDTSLFDKQFRWVYVKSQLVHGKIPISDTCATPVVSVRRRLRWQKVAVFDIQTREIPRDAALNVVVIGRKIKKKSKKGKSDHTDVVMAHGSFHLFDHNAVLAAGRQFLTLYAGADKDNLGEACGSLAADFESSCKPVVFPNHGGVYSDDQSLYMLDQELFDEDAGSHSGTLKREKGSADAKLGNRVDNTGDKQNRVLALPHDMVELVTRMATKETGLKVGDHGMVRRHKRSFRGCDVVTWLVEVASVPDREEALSLCQRLFRLHVFRHVTDDHDFADNTELFCFAKFSYVKALPGTRRLSMLHRTAEMHQKFLQQSAKIRSFKNKVSRANREHEDLKRIAHLCATDFLTPITDADKQMLFRCRKQCVKYPKLLPKFLQSIDWSLAGHVREAYRLLPEWETKDSPHVALELLNVGYPDSRVRQRAVELLDELADDDIEAYLLQLVQVLKFETYHDSPLARLLLRRALLNRRIGLAFFWHARSEMMQQEDPSRFMLILQSYVAGCGDKMLATITEQIALVSKLKDLSMLAVNAKGSTSSRSLLVREAMREVDLPAQCPSLYNSDLLFGEPVFDKVRVLDSKKRPLWYVAKNLDVTGQPVRFLFKTGDDLRQDMLTLQMIRLMDKLWQQEGLDFRMTPYNVVSTGRFEGVIEVVANATTVASIQRSSLGVFKDDLLHDWLQLHNQSDDQFDRAKDTFTMSCAGYCVSTYVLGIGDRHNDNIMVTKDGHFFHIDFGHFLGNIKSKFGVKRERAPFVLTPDFVYVMGKKDGPRFKKFVKYCVKAYLILRKHADLIIGLFAMMLSTGIPELQSAEDIQYLHNVLCLGMTEPQAAKTFEKLIYECLKLSWSTQLNFAIHNFAHGD